MRDAGQASLSHLPPLDSQLLTTVTAARERQGFSKSTAYKYANTLAEPGVATEFDSTTTDQRSGVLTR
jgi:DNA-binding IclR family transcriptional regulator